LADRRVFYIGMWRQALAIQAQLLSGESRRIRSGLRHHLLCCYWWTIETPYGLGSRASIAPARRTARRGIGCARALDPMARRLYKPEASGTDSGVHPAAGRSASPESAPTPSPVPANRGGIASAIGSILPCPVAYPSPRCEPANSIQAREGWRGAARTLRRSRWLILAEHGLLVLICVNTGRNCSSAAAGADRACARTRRSAPTSRVHCGNSAGRCDSSRDGIPLVFHRS